MKATELVKLIDPKLNPSYSPNLFKFANKWPARNILQVWRENDGGKLRIGYIDQEFAGTNKDCGFVGVPLNRVICVGAKTMKERCWFSNLGPGNMKHITDFWECYITIGRCAIDTDHKEYFVGDEGRYIFDGDLRTCTWCGAKHKRRVEVKTYTKEIEHFDAV